MTEKEKTQEYLSSLSDSKQKDLRDLHDIVLKTMPGCKLWFLDGKNNKGKIVSNPNIGYGSCKIKYADGSTKDFYQIGLSANTTGISVYFFGITDKTFLAKTYGKTIGKAKVTGYCIKFKTLNDLNVDVLKTAIQEINKMK